MRSCQVHGVGVHILGLFLTCEHSPPSREAGSGGKRRRINSNTVKRHFYTCGAQLLDILFVFSIFLVPAIWFIAPFNIPVPDGEPVKFEWRKVMILVPFVLAAFRYAAVAAARRKGFEFRTLWGRPLCRKLALSVVTLFVLLLAFEQYLEWSGFEAASPPIVIKDENQEVTGQYGIMKDMVLAWKFSPNGEFKGWKINRYGFKDREITKEKKPGIIRVICYGDSCTADGGPPYAGSLHQLLRDNPPTDDEWEAFNMGVYGYSTVQGLKYFKMVGREFKPDVVTLYFGWNDHWICGYRPDSHNLAFEMNRWSGAFLRRLQRKRFGQLLLRTVTPQESSMSLNLKEGEYPKELEELYRVPPDEFVYTLKAFIREVRAEGAVPILLTPPRGPELTEHLVMNGQAKSIPQVEEAHRQYVEMIREVAAETHCPLLDLADIMSTDEYQQLFNRDGIHLLQEGLWAVGDLIYEKIDEITDDPDWRENLTAQH